MNQETSDRLIRLTIYWHVKDGPARWKICRRFGIHYHVTVNGETQADIREEDLGLLRETARRGYFDIRFKRKS